MALKAKHPEEVLSLFLNPNRKYMSHFFHLKSDIPELKMETKHGVDKPVYQTQQPRLYLTDIDTIVRKHQAMKGRHSIAEIALGVLSVDLLDTLEKNHLDLEQTVQWGRSEALRKIHEEMKPIVHKTSKRPIAPKVKALIKVLGSLAPNVTSADLGRTLQEMVSDSMAMEAAVNYLSDKESRLGRDPKTGFIRLRTRANPA